MNGPGEIEKQKYRAFTIIEALTLLFIFVLITTTFYATWSTGTRHILLAKSRLIANALASEKIEVVRNMTFEKIALTTGDPAGNLHQEEDVIRSGLAFNVFTQIKNVDDPFDGVVGGDPDDSLAPIDYKYVKITVSWNGGKDSLSLSSRFVPSGIEQPSPDRGVLVVNVSSDKEGGAIVPQSTVRIQNSDTGYDETHGTDDLGRLMLVGLKESEEKKYQITITKAGYEEVTTMAPYPGTPYNPVHENSRIVAQALNRADIYQNELANFSVKTEDYLGSDLPSMHFYLSGGRKLGTDTVNPDISIYNMDSHDQTGSGGTKSYDEISPGNYSFTLEETGYKIVGSSSGLPFFLAPGQTTVLTAKLAREDATSFLVKVENGSDDDKPVAGAEVHLTNALGYDKAMTTGSDGMAFFPDDASIPFNTDPYDLSVTATGLTDHSGQVSIVSGQLKEELVSLTVPE